MNTTDQQRLKELSKKATGKIPKVGLVASMLLDAIWVVDTPSLWDQIRKDVAELVAKAIFEEKLKLLQILLTSYASTLKVIQGYEGRTQYDQLMGLRTKIFSEYEFFMNKDNDASKITAMLPLFTQMAVLHFTVTYLTATVGEENKQDEKENKQNEKEKIEPSEKNRAGNWAFSDLLKKQYYPYGRMSVKVANDWRQNQIEVIDNISVSPVAYQTNHYRGTLKCVDHVTGKTVLNKSYGKTGIDPTRDDREFIKAYKQEVWVQSQKYWQENALDIMEPWRFPDYTEDLSFAERMDAQISKAVDDAKKAYDALVNKINNK